MKVSDIKARANLLFVKVLKKDDVEVYSRLLDAKEKPKYPNPNNTDDLSSIVEVINSGVQDYNCGDMLIAYRDFVYMFDPVYLEDNDTYECYAFMEPRMVFANLIKE